LIWKYWGKQPNRESKQTGDKKKTSRSRRNVTFRALPG
jgi:hypothetical protein